MSVNAQFAQLGRSPLGLFDGDGFRVQDEDERRVCRIAHCRQRAFVLCAGVLNSGRRPNTGLAGALGGLVDGAAPLGRQFQQAQRVTGGGGVEDDHVERLAVLGRHIHKVGETIEGGHFGGTRAAHLLFHHLHHRQREGRPDGGHGAVDVFLGGAVRVNFHGPEVGDALNRCDPVADGLFKDVGQVRGRVGGDDEGSFSFVSVAHGGSTGHAGLAHTTFAREKDKRRRHQLPPFNAA